MATSLRYRIDLEFRSLEEEDLPESVVAGVVDRIVEFVNTQACDVDVMVERLSPVSERRID